MTTSPTITFTVSVDTTASPAVYTIYDEQGNATTAPFQVTAPNTIITYTLRADSNQLQFVAPVISGDPNHDLTYSISTDGQVLTLIDSDGDAEDICLQLVTVPTSAILVGPDPQMRNRPGN